MLGETVEKKEERINIGSGHFALYLTAFDVWKDSVLIGGGIKSFRINTNTPVTPNTNNIFLMEFIVSIKTLQCR